MPIRATTLTRIAAWVGRRLVINPQRGEPAAGGEGAGGEGGEGEGAAASSRRHSRSCGGRARWAWRRAALRDAAARPRRYRYRYSLAQAACRRVVERYPLAASTRTCGSRTRSTRSATPRWSPREPLLRRQAASVPTARRTMESTFRAASRRSAGVARGRRQRGGMHAASTSREACVSRGTGLQTNGLQR